MNKPDVINKQILESEDYLLKPVEVIVRETGELVASNRFYIILKTSETGYVSIFKSKILKIKRLRHKSEPKTRS